MMNFKETNQARTWEATFGLFKVDVEYSGPSSDLGSDFYWRVSARHRVGYFFEALDSGFSPSFDETVSDIVDALNHIIRPIQDVLGQIKDANA